MNNIIDTVRVIINRPKIHKDLPVGSLWHYGHFIHDFIMPMIAYMNENKVSWKTVYLITNNQRDKIGTFRTLAEKILNIVIIEEDDQLSEMPVVNIRHYSFGPYNSIAFKHIIPHIKKTLSLTESPYKVILIERGVSKLINDRMDNGKNRRYIPNHEELKEALALKFGDLFINVILENLSIEEQVSLFMGAHIVIGQHGAGLCNIIWITNPEALVIEFPPHQVDTFKNMCLAKKIKYVRSNPNPSRVLEICKKRTPYLWSLVTP
jgi:hypothetical protein